MLVAFLLVGCTSLLVEPHADSGEAILVRGAHLHVHWLRVARMGSAMTIVVDDVFRCGEP